MACLVAGQIPVATGLACALQDVRPLCLWHTVLLQLQLPLVTLYKCNAFTFTEMTVWVIEFQISAAVTGIARLLIVERQGERTLDVYVEMVAVFAMWSGRRYGCRQPRRSRWRIGTRFGVCFKIPCLPNVPRRLSAVFIFAQTNGRWMRLINS